MLEIILSKWWSLESKESLIAFPTGFWSLHTSTPSNGILQPSINSGTWNKCRGINSGCGMQQITRTLQGCYSTGWNSLTWFCFVFVVVECCFFEWVFWYILLEKVKCEVPENVHTLPWKVTGNSKAVRWGGGWGGGSEKPICLKKSTCIRSVPVTGISGGMGGFKPKKTSMGGLYMDIFWTTHFELNALDT